MRRFTPDDHERQRGGWRDAQLAEAAAALDADGVVVLGQVVSAASIAALRDKMLADVAAAQALGRVKNDYQGIRPPPCHPWLFADILHNDWVIAVTRAVLGDGVANVAYGANTAYPGSVAQACHADGGFLFPGLAHPSASLVVNVPLVAVDERNGATRIWPGSHRHLGAADHLRPTAAELAAWERDRPSVRACTAVGDVVIRDTRLWHCGMPNTTGLPRPMIAMIHHRRWLMGGFRAEAGTEAFFDAHPLLRHRIEYLPAPIDYLHAHHDGAAWTRGRATAPAMV